MFQRILVPLDGSRLSAQALPYSVEIGKRFDSEIILVRVIPPAGLVIAPQISAMEGSAATDLIAQEAQVKDVDNALPMRYFFHPEALSYHPFFCI